MVKFNFTVPNNEYKDIISGLEDKNQKFRWYQHQDSFARASDRKCKLRQRKKNAKCRLDLLEKNIDYTKGLIEKISNGVNKTTDKNGIVSVKFDFVASDIDCDKIISGLTGRLIKYHIWKVETIKDQETEENPAEIKCNEDHLVWLQKNIPYTEGLLEKITKNMRQLTEDNVVDPAWMEHEINYLEFIENYKSESKNN